MSVLLIGSGNTYKAVGGTSWSIPVPSGVKANDMGLLCMMNDDGNPITGAPSGWTELVPGGITMQTSFARVWTKQFQNGDTLSWTTNSTSGSATAFWLRGAWGAYLVGTPGIRSGTSATVTAPSVTTAMGRRDVAILFGERSTKTADEVDHIIGLSRAGQGAARIGLLARGVNNQAVGSASGTASQHLCIYEAPLTGAVGDVAATFGDSASSAFGLQFVLEIVPTYDCEVWDGAFAGQADVFRWGGEGVWEVPATLAVQK